MMFLMHDSYLVLKEAAAGIEHVFSKWDSFGQNVLEAMRAVLTA